MKHLKLRALVTGLALASLLGCSRSGKLADASAAKISAEVPLGRVQAKPSPCIKWRESPGKIRKSQQKAKAAPTPRNQQKTLQANDENHPL
jgi:hypothetical protein